MTEKNATTQSSAGKFWVSHSLTIGALLGEEITHAQADLRIVKDEPAEITLGIDEITYEESEDEEDTQVENLEIPSRKNLVAKKTEEKAKVPEASKKEFMSPDAQDLRGIVDTFDDHMEHEEQEIDEETEQERRVRKEFWIVIFLRQN